MYHLGRQFSYKTIPVNNIGQNMLLKLQKDVFAVDK